MKKLFLFLAALPIIFFAAGCSKDDASATTAKVRLSEKNVNEPSGLHVSAVDFTINGTKIEQSFTNSTQINLADNMPFTFKIKVFSIMMGEQPDLFISYSGTMNRDMFTAPETDYNAIIVSTDEYVPTVTVAGVTVPVIKGTSTGGGSPYTGIWVRQMGASGNETDIAIGNIPGAPANAVWMCESKGSVGLYKGTISGNTITFDAQYGLPTYTVSKNGEELILQGNMSGSLPTPYKKGSWAGSCGQLGN